MELASALFVSGVVAPPFALYTVLALRRKARFRSLAARLGARHVDGGWFAPGKIVGDRFEIEARKAGKRFVTNVRFDVGDTPGPYLLKPGFFGATPDWTCAKVLGARDERVFLWKLKLRGYVEPAREQQDELRRWLAGGTQRSGMQELLVAAAIRELVVADGCVTTTFPGIVSDYERLRSTLDALRRFDSADDRSALRRSA